jgi:hypothetical protein
MSLFLSSSNDEDDNPLGVSSSLHPFFLLALIVTINQQLLIKLMISLVADVGSKQSIMLNAISLPRLQRGYYQPFLPRFCPPGLFT